VGGEVKSRVLLPQNAMVVSGGWRFCIAFCRAAPSVLEAACCFAEGTPTTVVVEAERSSVLHLTPQPPLQALERGRNEWYSKQGTGSPRTLGRQNAAHSASWANTRALSRLRPGIAANGEAAPMEAERLAFCKGAGVEIQVPGTW